MQHQIYIHYRLTVQDFSQSTQTFGKLIAVICKSQCLSFSGFVILGAFNTFRSFRSYHCHANFDTFCTSKQHIQMVFRFALLFRFMLLPSTLSHCIWTIRTRSKYYNTSRFDSICWNYTLAPLFMFVSGSLSISFAPPLSCTLRLHKPG